MSHTHISFRSVLLVCAPAIGAIAAAAASPSVDCPSDAGPPYNILLIVLDDVGTDKLGVYGETPTAHGPHACQPPFTCEPFPCPQPYPYPPTPNIDALASCGVRFTNAYANPVCSPTRAELLTGRYAFRTGMGSVMEASAGGNSYWEVRDCEKFVSELLKRPQVPGGPYACGAFGKWHLSGASPIATPSHPIRNGFDKFQGMWANPGNSINANHYKWVKVTNEAASPAQAPTFDGYNITVDSSTGALTCTYGSGSLPACNAAVFSEDTWDASVTRQDAEAWITAQTGPFFAYVAFNPPHEPFQLPPFELLSDETVELLTCTQPWGGPYAPGDIALPEGSTPDLPEMQRKVFWRATMEAVDAEIGKLIDALKAGDKFDDTMIIVIGDNGTVGFGESIMDSPPHVLTHGKKTVYQHGVRVPLIVSGPLADPGTVCSGLVSAVDVWRTLGKIAGLTDNQINAYVRENAVPSPCIQAAGAGMSCVAAQTPMDSKSFLNLIGDHSATSNRSYAFSQIFVPNGEYLVVDDQTAPIAYVWNGSACNVSNPAVSNLTSHDRAITDGTWKLIVKLDTAMCPPPQTPCYTEELYNIVTDFHELSNEIANQPTIATTLRNQLRALSGN